MKMGETVTQARNAYLAEHPKARVETAGKEAAAHTRAHAFIVMRAYLVRCTLARAWAGLELAVEEGLRQLTPLCATEINSITYTGNGWSIKMEDPS